LFLFIFFFLVVVAVVVVVIVVPTCHSTNDLFGLRIVVETKEK